MIDSRKEFELWAAFEFMAYDFTTGAHGEYLDDLLQHSWLGWNARCQKYLAAALLIKKVKKS
jgi:hypothetical protein